MTLAVVLSSCNDYETYGDKKEKERNAIAKFIADSSIVVISEDQFKQQGMTTDVKRNEFVKFDKNGVYMQIVRSGCGTGLGAKESTTLVCRYREFNILNDTIQSWNDTPQFAARPDIMNVTRNSGTFTSSFTSGVMYTLYGGSVPSGWMVPSPTSRWVARSRLKRIVPRCASSSPTLRGTPPLPAMWCHSITSSRSNVNHKNNI